jgi:hypothetical protein
MAPEANFRNVLRANFIALLCECAPLAGATDYISFAAARRPVLSLPTGANANIDQSAVPRSMAYSMKSWMRS